VSGDEQGHTNEARMSAAEIAHEIRLNPNGLIAQTVRKATHAADRFAREWADLERKARGEGSS